MCQAVHLVYRRPVAYRESLRDCTTDSLPVPITPELLIRGYNLSVSIIPSLQSLDDLELDPNFDTDPISIIRDSNAKLRKVRTNLIEIYNIEFLTKLIGQATDDKSRYKPVSHDPVEVGDIVLLRKVHYKPTNFPMAVVKSVIINDLSEVTAVTVFKGVTRELVKRHASTIIPPC